MEHRIKLSQIANILMCELFGADIDINGLNLCNRETKYSNIVSYINDEKYMEYVIKNKNIKALIVTKECYESNKKILDDYSILTVKNPEESFYLLHHYLYENMDFYNKFDFDSRIGTNCIIHPMACIEKGVCIGDNVFIGAYSIIKSGTLINDNVMIGNYSIIGSEGFQIINGSLGRMNIRHVGGVILDNASHIGDHCAVCKSLFEDNTTIGKYTQIDNFSQIAHNSTIGNNVVITAGVILCGSTTIEDGVWIGVNSSVLNKVTIEKNSLIGIGSVVTRNIQSDSIAYGVPAKVK